jgi:predicted nucleotidyltransferase
MNRLTKDDDSLARLCRRYHISRLSLYGSVLKGYERPDSDVDLLVEFEQGKAPGLLGIAEIETELSSRLGGRKVDLRTEQDLSPHFRKEVTNNAEVQYAI